MFKKTLDSDKPTEEFALKMYQEFYPLVKYIVKKIIDDTDSIEDVVQETFISLLDKLELLESLELYKLNSYIAITAKRKAYSFNEKRSKTLTNEFYYTNESNESIIDTIPSASKSIEEIIEYQEDYSKIMSIMDRLPDKYKEILLLKYRYDYKDDEIAAQFNLKPNSVRMYLKRSREKLLRLIEGENIYEFRQKGLDTKKRSV